MNGIGMYQKTAVETQDKGRLIIMLYEGAIKFLNRAASDLEAGDYQGKGKNIQKALDIIYELNTVLDMKTGGEIAQNLRKLYNFMIRHLHTANMKKDVQMIRDVIGILSELKQGWEAVSG